MSRMNLFNVVRALAWILAMQTLTLAAADRAKAAEPPGEKPNVIFIMVDDMGVYDLGCYGQKNIQTPNVDRLAAEGMRFTQCYAGSAVCAPSRSVLMTGRHSGHTRVRGNSGIVGGVGSQRRVPLEAEDVTIAEVLKTAGYATGITGKWGLGEPDTTGVPNRQGFDEWFGYLNQQHAHSYYPEYLWHNETKVVLEGNLDGKREQYSHDLMTEFALKFIKQHQDEPFFLYIPWTVPHQKYEIPSLGHYADKPWTEEEKVNAAMISRMDTDVGKIMALLAECGIDGRTIVFFCSDNGAAKRWEGVFDSCGPLRGNKGAPYEGGLRTPMIVRWPDRVPAGTTSDLSWYFADVLPTVAELVGAETPDNLDGVSVLPTILGKPQRLDDRILYWELPWGRFPQIARRGDWKVVRPPPGQPLELYNLGRDPSEKSDIATEHPELVKQFEDYLATARFDSPNWPWKKP